MIVRYLAVLTLVLALVAATACKTGRDPGDDPTPDDAVLDSGESLGEITRLPGGTPVPTDVRTLLSAACDDGVLTLRTNREQITSPMDCTQMLPDAAMSSFIGQPVAIRAQDGRLIVESQGAGTVDFPAAEPRIEEIDGAP